MDERQLLLAIIGRALELCQCRLIRNTKDAETSAAREQLDRAVENWRAWTTSSHEVDQPALLQGRNCRDCQHRIFFAQELVNHRWLPLDVEPVEAVEVNDEWRYRVDLSVDPPRVFHDLDGTTGRVYLHHRWTCPMGNGPTKALGPAYRRRYKANTARLDKDQIQAVDSLRALLQKFDSDDAEGD